MEAGLLALNGVDGESGVYFTPPISIDRVADVAARIVPDRLLLAEQRQRVFAATQPAYAAREGVDPKDLAETGWAIIFAAGEDPAVIEALAPLIDHRRGQVGDDRRLRVLSGDDGYVSGESKLDYLIRIGAPPSGQADPDRFPYYVLLVGGPEVIPFEVQYGLDVQYAVGRIELETAERYAAYARSTVAAESTVRDGPARVALFGTRQDAATEMSSTKLIAPIDEAIRSTHPHVDLTTFIGKEATKERLGTLIGGTGTPDLLLAATHGLGFRSGSADQLDRQGALVCEGWAGPGNAVLEEHTFAADDIDGAADVAGLIVLVFACFGAGTPRFDDFTVPQDGERRELARAAFVSALPKRLLGHPGGGALAVIGHVERAWSYSFSWQGDAAYTAVFEDSVRRLLDGHPVGSALEYFNIRHAELAVDLDELIRKLGDVAVDRSRLAGLWTAKNDARNFILLGDPAVRLIRSSGLDAVNRISAEL